MVKSQFGRWQRLVRVPEASIQQLLALKKPATVEEVKNVLSPLKDSIRIHAVVHSLAKQRRADVIYAALSEAVPDATLFTVGIAACGKENMWQCATSLFAMMPQFSIAPNVFACTAAIKACGKRWHLGLQLFQEMPLRQVRPNEISYNATISLLEKGGQWERALHLFISMPERQIAPNVISYNTTISALEKGQQWQGALQLFGSMEAADIQPDVVSYNSSISSCNRVGQWQTALHFFEVMQQKTILPDVVTFGSVMSAIGSSWQWQPAMTLLQDMQDASLADLQCFSTAMTCLEKCHQWECGLQILNFAVQQSHQPDTIFFNAALAALAKSNLTDAALGSY